MWEQKIVLREGERLQHEGSKMTGFMQETDIDTYSIIGPDGSKTGTVTVEDHTAVRGFRRTITVKQVDTVGKLIVDERFTVR